MLRMLSGAIPSTWALALAFFLDRIPSLKSYGQALEQECCFPGVLCNDGDASANLLYQLWPYDAMYQPSPWQRDIWMLGSYMQVLSRPMAHAVCGRLASG